MPRYFPCCRELGRGVGLVGVSATMLGTSTPSFWNRDRFASRRRLNWDAECVPSSTGAMNLGHRRRQTERMERISRPECFARESQTAEPKRIQTSLVSFAPSGSLGEGSVRESIWRISALV
jgi:hypothetical protein